MSQSFHFFIYAENNHRVIYEAQYILDITMANSLEVTRIMYVLHCVHVSFAIKGFIWFNNQKALTMAEGLLPGFNFKISAIYENETLFSFLKQQCVCIKIWLVDDDTWEMTLE